MLEKKNDVFTQEIRKDKEIVKDDKEKKSIKSEFFNKGAVFNGESKANK